MVYRLWVASVRDQRRRKQQRQRRDWRVNALKHFRGISSLNFPYTPVDELTPALCCVLDSANHFN